MVACCKLLVAGCKLGQADAGNGDDLNEQRASAGGILDALTQILGHTHIRGSRHTSANYRLLYICKTLSGGKSCR